MRQSNNINMRFTVRDLVAFGRFPYSQGRLTAEDHRIIEESMQHMEIDHFQDRFIDQLSGGQRQMAFIAMKLGEVIKAGTVGEVIDETVLSDIYEIPFIVQEIDGNRFSLYYRR